MAIIKQFSFSEFSNSNQNQLKKVIALLSTLVLMIIGLTFIKTNTISANQTAVQVIPLINEQNNVMNTAGKQASQVKSILDESQQRLTNGINDININPNLSQEEQDKQFEEQVGNIIPSQNTDASIQKFYFGINRLGNIVISLMKLVGNWLAWIFFIAGIIMVLLKAFTRGAGRWIGLSMMGCAIVGMILLNHAEIVFNIIYNLGKLLF